MWTVRARWISTKQTKAGSVRPDDGFAMVYETGRRVLRAIASALEDLTLRGVRAVHRACKLPAPCRNRAARSRGRMARGRANSKIILRNSTAQAVYQEILVTDRGIVADRPCPR